MNTDSGLQAYRKLKYFFDNKIPIHFCLLKGGWKNGEILDLNEEKLTMVLKEFKDGELPFLLEDVDSNTIKRFKIKGEKI